MVREDNDSERNVSSERVIRGDRNASIVVNIKSERRFHAFRVSGLSWCLASPLQMFSSVTLYTRKLVKE